MANAESIDLSGLSPEDLVSLIARCEARKTEIVEEESAAAFAQMEKIAQGVGMSAKDLAARFSKGKRKSGSKIPPKYRNPENASETWTGRGRKPKWVETLLAKGGDLKSAAI